MSPADALVAVVALLSTRLTRLRWSTASAFVIDRASSCRRRHPDRAWVAAGWLRQDFIDDPSFLSSRAVSLSFDETSAARATSR